MRAKSYARITFLLAAIICIFNINTAAQATDQHINLTVRPGADTRERVVDPVKVQELNKTADDKPAAEQAPETPANDPKSLLARARVIYITSETKFFKPVQLQGALRKRSEFDALQLSMVDAAFGGADVLIEIDRPIFTYYFTYKIIDRKTTVVLGAGKVTAFDGKFAAPLLARDIMKDFTAAQKKTKTTK